MRSLPISLVLFSLLLLIVACTDVGLTTQRGAIAKKTTSRNQCPSVCKFRKKRFPDFQNGNRTFVIVALIQKSQRIGTWRVLTIGHLNTYNYMRTGSPIPVETRRIWVHKKANQCTCFRLKKKGKYLMAGYVKQPRNPDGPMLVLNETSAVLRYKDSIDIRIQKLLHKN
ncbi:netrin-1-like [Corticium candelabrum]|uniref:netrin-1-like n=1 Tax=Corticium candelabrum TaxID=121492 RepID=UPI002E276A2B|nr:netrin-1-like [Corticium candelabrum]